MTPDISEDDRARLQPVFAIIQQIARMQPYQDSQTGTICPICRVWVEGWVVGVNMPHDFPHAANCAVVKCKDMLGMSPHYNLHRAAKGKRLRHGHHNRSLL